MSDHINLSIFYNISNIVGTRSKRNKKASVEKQSFRRVQTYNIHTHTHTRPKKSGFGLSSSNVCVRASYTVFEIRPWPVRRKRNYPFYIYIYITTVARQQHCTSALVKSNYHCHCHHHHRHYYVVHYNYSHYPLLPLSTETRDRLHHLRWRQY